MSFWAQFASLQYLVMFYGVAVSEQSIASDVLLQTCNDRVQMVRAANQGRKIHPEGGYY